MVKNLAVVTGSRAEWGLLQPLAKRIHDDPDLNLQLLVTGSHLSHEFGYTVDQINLPISAKVEIVLSSNTSVGISKSLGLAMISFSEVYDRLKPDLLICLGDRYETFAAVSAAHIARIPIAHIHGGELTAGSLDDAFRHSITKMSHLHFPATEEYQQRIIQLGEWPGMVFNVGALGCDGLVKRAKSPNLKQILLAYYGDDISDLLPEFANIIEIYGSHDVHYINGGYYSLNLSRDAFLDILVDSDAIVGNSSAGIIEAPALGVPTINIGSRQKGRIMADSIIHAEPTKKSIQVAFDKLYSPGFQARIQRTYYTPYKGQNVAAKILEIIKVKLQEGIKVEKEFYDLISNKKILSIDEPDINIQAPANIKWRED